jgi:hypothetical protein
LVKLKELETWLTSGDVMKITGRTKQGAINLVKKGRVRGVKTRAGWLYDPKSLEAYLEETHGRVVNVKSGEPFDVYIGRANPRKGLKQSIWHNPFKEGKDGTREEVIEKYERHLLEERPDLLERLPELKGKVLACWCAPEPCHGDVLLDLAWER